MIKHYKQRVTDFIFSLDENKRTIKKPDPYWDRFKVDEKEYNTKKFLKYTTIKSKPTFEKERIKSVVNLNESLIDSSPA